MSERSDSRGVLIYADSMSSPEMRREIPHAVKDPFLYVEWRGKRYTVSRSLEIERMRSVTDLEPLSEEELGLDELVARGVPTHELPGEIALAACRRLGVASASVPASFPLAIADRLREGGVELRPDADLFTTRQRVKTEQQLAGIRRAQRAAEAAVGAIADLLRAASVDGEGVVLDGEPLTSERLKRAGRVAIADCGMVVDDYIVAHGPQTCIGHHPGSGLIAVGEPITVDLGPHDPETGCFTDMTRTFVVGPASDELVEYHGLAREALERSVAAVRPGVCGTALSDIASEVFEARGHPTLRRKAPGEVLMDGFFHTLGHGVGLRIHEPPSLGPTGGELVAGDVVAIEPGCYRQGYGGVRLEDLLLVTDDGAEVLTEYPYGLAP